MHTVVANLMILLALIALPCAAAPAARAYGEAAEGQALRRAIAQTVEIRTTIEHGLASDTRGSGRGAGFVVDRKRGWIATARHVVGTSPSQVEVAVDGDTFRGARKRYVDPLLDLAILEVDPLRIRSSEEADLACASQHVAGQSVVLIGHPANLRYTATRGIVSRTAVIDGEALIQTDAAIGPGNSGGPLISLSTGQVIGVAVKRLNGSSRVGFAVPADGLCRILDLLRQGVDPRPPELQVSFFSSDDQMPQTRIARIWNSARTLPLEQGDQIVAVVGDDGAERPVKSESDILNALRGRLDGIRLRVLRAGKSIVVAGSAAAMGIDYAQLGVSISGVLFGNPSERLAREFAHNGPIVYETATATEGELKDFRAGDLVLAVDGKPVQSVADLVDAAAHSTGEIVVTMRRMHGESFRVWYLEKTLRTKGLVLVGETTSPDAIGSLR